MWSYVVLAGGGLATTRQRDRVADGGMVSVCGQRQSAGVMGEERDNRLGQALMRAFEDGHLHLAG